MLSTPTTAGPNSGPAIGWTQVLTPQLWQQSGVMVGGTERNTDALSLLVRTSSVHPGKAHPLVGERTRPVPADHSIADKATSMEQDNECAAVRQWRGDRRDQTLVWWNMPKTNHESNHHETQPVFFTESSNQQDPPSRPDLTHLQEAATQGQAERGRARGASHTPRTMLGMRTRDGARHLDDRPAPPLAAPSPERLSQGPSGRCARDRVPPQRHHGVPRSDGTSEEADARHHQSRLHMPPTLRCSPLVNLS